MKKHIALLLAALTLAFAGCGSNDDDESSVSSKSDTSANSESAVESEAQTNTRTEDNTSVDEESSAESEESYLAESATESVEDNTDVDFSQITLGDTTVMFGETTLIELLEGGWGFAGDYAENNNDYWLTTQLEPNEETESLDYSTTGIQLYSSANDCTIYVKAANTTDETIDAADGVIVFFAQQHCCKCE